MTYRHSRSVRVRSWHLALALCGAVSACVENEANRSVAPAPASQLSAQLTVTLPVANDSMALATIHVVNPGAIALASLTAAIVYDTTRIRFVSEASPPDGALRAANASRGRVLVAAAHTTGFAAERVAVLRFVSRDSAALREMAMQITELHLTNAADVRGAVTVAATRVVR
ncbi:MAG: hypothetical protein IT353_07535 [Gemmatimonadaceae bacterium]|nr:hypothetical protein [Gemmatimonadaceae bacterium]